MLVAVIDLGKTNSKVAIVDTACAQEIQVVTQTTAVNDKTPYPSLNHQLIENFIFTALAELSKRHTIDAVTVATHGATGALLDAKGKLVLPVMDYEFKGVDDRRDEYNNHRPPFSITGSPSLPGGLNIGAQLYWLQKEFAAEFATATVVLTWPQYWVHLLCGKQHNDVTSLGCHTDLYQPLQQQYSTLVNTMQWGSLMPTTRCSGELSGPILPAVGKKTGLATSTGIYTGIHDSNASLVPHLIVQTAPFSVVSTGTWFISMAIGDKKIDLDETKDTLLNVNARGEAVPSARFMGGRERELLEVTSASSEVDLEELLQLQSPPLLLPSVVPDTGPYPGACTRWINPVSTQSIQNCAVTLYLSLMTMECLKLIGSDGPTFIEGPLAHDHHFAQMLTAATSRPVFVSDSQTGTSVGAAMLISAPETLPQYTEIHLSAQRRQQMEIYTALWLRHLQAHTI